MRGGIAGLPSAIELPSNCHGSDPYELPPPQ
jgi:hypothetical protein